MGHVVSKLTTQQSAWKQLEELEENITKLELGLRKQQESRDSTLNKLLVSSITCHIILVIYACALGNQSQHVKLKTTVNILLLSTVTYLAWKLVTWYFDHRIDLTLRSVIKLKNQKRFLLDQVCETHTYKAAKQIIDRFDVAPPVKISSQPHASVARRSQSKHSNPLPPPTPTIFDRFVDYLVKDGVDYRSPLVCKQCKWFNGNVMKEEKDYFSFKCVKCGLVNGPLKKKPVAPPLTLTQPKPLALCESKDKNL